MFIAPFRKLPAIPSTTSAMQTIHHDRRSLYNPGESSYSSYLIANQQLPMHIP